MNNYNYKVVVELRSGLSEEDQAYVVKKIENLQNRLRIINIDAVTYCKAQPINGHDDFGAVAFFFSALKDMKQYFARLEYYDLWRDRKRVAV